METLENGTGKGNDFLGWLHLPSSITAEHLAGIIGMILAGLVIGEHGFNILVRDSSFELFGKVGLYYMVL